MLRAIAKGAAIEVRNRLAEGDGAGFGHWTAATLHGVGMPGILFRVDGETRLQMKGWEDEGITWRLAQATGPGKETPK